MNDKLETVKWSNFAAIYDQFPVRGAALEIGIRKGGSLRDLKRRCGGNIYGIDLQVIEPIDDFTLIEGDATHVSTLRKLQYAMSFNLDYRLAMVVDNGSHRPFDQVDAFRLYWPLVATGGVYIIEDLHMSEKWRWLIYRILGFRGVWTLINEFSKRQNSPYEGTERVTRMDEVHLYPHIAVFRKTVETIEIVIKLL